MGSNRKNRMPADQVQANIDAYLALKAMPGYKPYNPAFSLEAITAAVELLRTAEVNDLHAEHARLAARDAIVAAQWALQDIVVGAKEQVRAIYGPDSDEMVQVGLKKKSEKKARSRTSKPAAVA
ncbi:hypothetical protein [Zoogloea sp.]|uniref:hypothetical protein n=1 Tax=Zoogloea sp. TaxID=49181 RepID=UPI0035B17FDA